MIIDSQEVQSEIFKVKSGCSDLLKLFSLNLRFLLSVPEDTSNYDHKEESDEDYDHQGIA